MEKKITPFSISPDPTSLYLTPTLKSVLFKVNFTLEKRQGLTTILGDVGIGKSSLMRHIYSSYAAREDARPIFMAGKKGQTVFNFLREICNALEIGPRRSYGRYFEALEEKLIDLMRQDINVILFIDEGNLLDTDGLELVRSMLNFESNTAKAIQVVLAGQLDLKDRLFNEKHRAIRSRISTYSLLNPLGPQEIGEMLVYRSERAGIAMPFTASQVEEIYTQSAGIPRVALKIAAIAYDIFLQIGEVKLEGLTAEVAAA